MTEAAALGLLLALAGALAHAQVSVPRAEPVPGGIAVVPLAASGGSPPLVTYRRHRVMVYPRDGRWVAIVGVPLEAAPGRHRLSVRGPGGAAREVVFEVRGKRYATQYITVENERHVTPNAADLERIGRERREIRAALAHWGELLPERLALDVPVHGVVSSPFGLRRYFNGQPRRPHSGLDIAAPQGTAIRAPLAARVVATGNYFFNGNSVFLDHGQGLITVYFHMQRIDVVPGQRVARGETIGSVGMTGRVTGPHLHWGVTLNQALVDPRLLMSPPAGSRSSAGE